MTTNSLLLEIKDKVQEYAEVISQVIGLEVEIMDENLIRVAGTGILKKKSGLSMEKESHIYKQVLAGGITQIVVNPGYDTLCLDCDKKNNCNEKLEISMPIKFKNKPIGVIGLICFLEGQKDNFIKNQENFIKFLEQISSFISSKIFENIQKKMSFSKNEALKKILNEISDAIVLLDDKKNVIHMNKKSLNLFKIQSIIPNHSFVCNKIGEAFMEKTSFSIKFNDIDIVGIGELVNLSPHEELLIFKEKIEFQEEVLQIINSTSSTLVKEFLFSSIEMKSLYERLKIISKNQSTVLITGESGTGKEMVARTIHIKSPRNKNPFIAINCGAIPEALLESELFGYSKGAFTGADSKGKIGKFELANRGTIFLDEIGDMPLYMQVKLLRVLQERSIVKIGSHQLIDIDVRIIAATNKNLEKLIAEGSFRADLFYRLNVIPIEIPPLRKRLDDIELFTNYFSKRYSKLFMKNFSEISPEVIKLFQEYSWPGNVRELENTVEYMVNIMGEDGILTENCIPNKIKTIKNTQIKHKSLDEIEKNAIIELLNEFGHTKKAKIKISNILNIGIATLYRKIEKYHILEKIEI